MKNKNNNFFKILTKHHQPKILLFNIIKKGIKKFVRINKYKRTRKDKIFVNALRINVTLKGVVALKQVENVLRSATAINMAVAIRLFEF